LLIDIGSTTTDIIPLMNGAPCPNGKTDLSRLQSGELVYTGVRRTPLAAGIIIPFRERWITVSSELFATTLDVHLLRGDIPENPQDTDTANGRPATRAAAIDRIVRMLCADRTEITEAETTALADGWAHQQLAQIERGIQQVLRRQPAPCETVFVSGSGEFLARRVVEQMPALQSANVVSLSKDFTPAIAEAACAYALACLAETSF
jgi:probable H4MPT-linked C1 transfer pathway protein